MHLDYLITQDSLERSLQGDQTSLGQDTEQYSIAHNLISPNFQLLG